MWKVYCRRNSFLGSFDYYLHLPYPPTLPPLTLHSHAFCARTKGISIHDIKTMECFRPQIKKYDQHFKRKQRIEKMRVFGGGKIYWT